MLLCQGLAGNTIGNEGGKALGKALENNSSLQTLNLNREWKKIYMFAGVQERQLALPNKHLLFAYVLYAFVCECVRERERGESAIMSAFGSAFLVLGWGWQGKICARHFVTACCRANGWQTTRLETRAARRWAKRSRPTPH